MTYDSKQLKAMADTARAVALGAVLSAHSGHIGIVLGAADIITTIYANFMRQNDRFVLSAGHGSALLYAVLKLSGWPIGDINTFRQLGGLPGHPEYGIAGVDATTGPLGQGVGNAVGLALAQKIKKESQARVYCLCSDGDLMEGVAQEAIAFAGRYKLNNLILLWDDNRISIDGVAQTDVDVPARMCAAGWRVISVDGADYDALNVALRDASRGNMPVFIQCKTNIGAGSSVAGTARAHGFALKDAEMQELIKILDNTAGRKLWKNVAKLKKRTVDAATKRITMPRNGVDFNPDQTMISTRELSGMYLEQILDAGVSLVGGSADLGSSTNSHVAASRDIVPPKFDGNYINYGVREHAMGAIMNGLCVGGLRPYGATFLVFSDYMRASIRLAALSGLPAIYLFTHDTISVGEDGPTHQPVEQLPSLRLIPNLNVWRPCNGAEVAFAWRAAISDTSHPTALILSRQKFRQIPSPADAEIARGAYVIHPARKSKVRATIIATGAEVPLAVDVASRIGPDVQVVSMPNVSAFRAQNADYKNKILRGRVIAIEASASTPWFEFADAVVGIDTFGASGPGGAVYSHFGFDVDAIVPEISRIIK